MAQWRGSNRRERLPAHWKAIRLRIGKRDGWKCQWLDHTGQCLAPATHCDHIARGDDDRDENLQMLCEDHHNIKSSREGGQASAEKKRQYRKKIERPRESHPTGTTAGKPKYAGF